MNTCISRILCVSAHLIQHITTKKGKEKAMLSEIAELPIIDVLIPFDK